MSFQKTPKNSLLTYIMMADVTLAVATTLVADIREALEASPATESILIDFKNFDLDYRAFKVFTPFAQELRRSKRQLYALAENKSIFHLIQQEGMAQVIKPIANINEITGEVTVNKPAQKIDVSFINPFIAGTLHVLDVQCNTKAVPQKPSLKAHIKSLPQIDIAGIIGISSKSFSGSIAVCFPEKVFLHLMTQMLGEECKEINDEMKDGAGELTNIIFGYAKKVLNENGHTIEKALPSVVRAPNIKLDHSSSQESIVLPFQIGDMEFFMEIGLENA